jgi:catalase
MTTNSNQDAGQNDHLSIDLLDALDKLFGLHPGFRAVHAKGVFCTGDFTPSGEAAGLTRAPHAVRPSTPVVVRFSDFAGVPTIPDNAPNGAGPRGFAIRFHLGEHVHTDIIGHSEDGFPTRTGEEFLALARALVASGPDAPKPTALDTFFASHPKAMHFLTAPKPFPISFSKESFYAVTAFRFTNQQGASKFGRFKIRPEAGNAYLSDAAAAEKSPNYLIEEIALRLAKEPVKFRILVQIAAEGDDVSDATVTWPAARPEIEFGTFTLTSFADQSDPELRKIIFDPVPRVDGIDPSDDPLIPVRSALYLLGGRRRRAAGATG